MVDETPDKFVFFDWGEPSILSEILSEILDIFNKKALRFGVT